MADSAEPRSPPPGAAQGGRFSAFISYSHRDAAFARRLHRDLEGYRLPHRLAARSRSGKRLKPIFRDSDELSATYDLTVAVREAIDQAEHLIVVCSPNAVQSPWVGREIELFRALHGDSAILAVLAEGEPAQAFPQALRHALDGHAVEPLAADFRPEGGGRRLEILRLVAVLAGVRLDELVQRDAHRQVRRMALAAGGAVAGLAVVGALAVVALNARAEADVQAARAGHLGDFMLSDLRKGLQAAGRLDLLAQVNKAALSAYSAKDATPDAVIRHAKALQAEGEDDEKRGDVKAARARFDEAHGLTATLLAAGPNDPKRIFAHAQSEYWEGFVAWREGDGAKAKSALERYSSLAAQLVRLDPANDAWLMEAAYASNNLGTLALRQAGDPARAEGHFREALADIELIARHRPRDPDILSAKANKFAWIADCQRLRGAPQEALVSREAQRVVLAELLAKNPRDVEAEADMLGHDLAVARIDASQGQWRRAVSRLRAGRKAAKALEQADPDNRNFPKLARMFELFEVRTWLEAPPRVRPQASELARTLGDCRPIATGASFQEIGDFCGVLLARLRAQLGDKQGMLAALAPVELNATTRHDILTARWGLNLGDEARLARIADNRGKMR